MPTLNLPKRPKNKQKHSVNAKCYDARWNKLRKSYFMLHPLCEICLNLGRTTATQEIHHIKPISTAKDDMEREQLLLSWDNLMALCEEHHHEIHRQLRGGYI